MRPNNTTIGYTQGKQTSDDETENPKKWSSQRKWVITVLVSGFTFITPVSSSMVAPALAKLTQELDVKREFEKQLTLSIFLLAYAFGPLFFAPLSETIGRRKVLLASNAFFFAWNLGCGFARNKAELLAFRFLSGIGGSAPLAIGAGVLSDVWEPEERGKAVAIWSLGPLLGPVIGPIAGGFITERTTWRWVFWATSAVAGVIGILGFFLLRESHRATLLATKRTSNHSSIQTSRHSIQIVSVYVAYLFGLFYLLLSTIPPVYQIVYGESTGIIGLHYIALGLGSFIGIFIYVRVCDRLYIRLKTQNQDIGCPEFRIPPMYAGSLLVPIGLFWYGWTLQTRQQWILPDIGITIFSVGIMLCLQPMQSYIIDAYATYAASGLAAVIVLRSLFEFAFPLFAPYLYEALGDGWGNSLLGFISIGIGIPSPFIFWYAGKKLRSISKYSAG
ncbi:major facilitator superfamily domain-containing protein [Xylariomycetidae sp. FL2044]|nr:major facilitator superfamily domain-containing protein [Xylariomycetidae sp. FL2044]